MEDKIFEAVRCSKHTIAGNILEILKDYSDSELCLSEWVASRYVPTPTIIEAAQTLYRNHSVDDISRNDAGAQNLSETTKAITRIIEECKKDKKKAICFVTGVPGAGKTLAGLNSANGRHKFADEEHAVFLSGNGPIVDVLQMALAEDRASREGITIEATKREKGFLFRSFISLEKKHWRLN